MRSINYSRCHDECLSRGSILSDLSKHRDDSSYLPIPRSATPLAVPEIRIVGLEGKGLLD